jgi:hypothetical protein
MNRELRCLTAVGNNPVTPLLRLEWRKSGHLETNLALENHPANMHPGLDTYNGRGTMGGNQGGHYETTNKHTPAGFSDNIDNQPGLWA